MSISQFSESLSSKLVPNPHLWTPRFSTKPEQLIFNKVGFQELGGVKPRMPMWEPISVAFGVGCPLRAFGSSFSRGSLRLLSCGLALGRYLVPL